MGLSCLRLPVYENQALSNHVVDMFIWGLLLWLRYEAGVIFCKVYEAHPQIIDTSSNDIELPVL